jgi:energy-coupling factor transporter ATP-binding protein EcfA2
MDGDRIHLGTALDAKATGPLVAQSRRHGKLVAVWPYGPGFAPHCLVVGSTGNGKSTLLRWMVADLVTSTGPKAVSLADGKFSGSFLMFRDLPGVVAIASTSEEITSMVRGYFAEVERRYQELSAAREQALKTRGRPHYQPPGPLFLVLDEYLNWVLSLADKTRKEMIANLVRIGSIGREVNGRMVLATQRPGTRDGVDTGLPGVLKAQMRCRIACCGHLGIDSLEARMAFDDDGYAGRMPAPRHGAAFAKLGRHEVAFVVPWLADPTAPETSDEDREAAWRLLPRPVVSLSETVAG